MVEFREFRNTDYQKVCDFLIELNQVECNHINWNWARFEWMYEHPEFDKESKDYIGLWWDKDKVVGAAIYDMYFGEAFAFVLPEYMDIYEDVLEYTYDKLRDESGVGIAFEDGDIELIKTAEKHGFKKTDQTETILKLKIDKKMEYQLEEGLIVYELIPENHAYDFSWLLWQGFDHGNDKREFEKESLVEGKVVPQERIHLNPKLSLAVKDEKGELVAYCCLWYDKRTDYVYVEPVCTIPEYRNRGLAKAALFEAFNRAKDMGAKMAYVISDMNFYKKLGFVEDKHFTFYWKL